MFILAFLAFLLSAGDGITIYTSHAQVNRLEFLGGKLVTMSSGGICVSDSSGHEVVINNSDGLLDNNAMDAVFDENGNLFAGTSSGLTVFSRDFSEFIQLTSFFQGIPHGEIRELEYRDDTLWAGGENGCWCWNTGGNPLTFSYGHSSRFLSDRTVNALLLNGDILAAGTVGELFFIPAGTFGDTTTYSGFSKGLSAQESVLSVVVYNDTVWISTSSYVKFLSGDSFVSTGINSRKMRLSVVRDTLFVNDYENWSVKRWNNGTWNQYGPGIPSRPVSVSLNPDGRLCAGTATLSNYCYESNSWRQVMPPGLFKPLVSSAAMLPNGIIAAIHFGNDYGDAVSLRYPDGEWEILTSLNYDTTGDWGAGRFISVRNDSTFVIGVWGRPGALIFLYPGKTSADSSRFEKLALPYTPSDQQQPISALTVDPNGDVWCASFDNQGPYLFRVKPDNSVITYYNNLFIYIYSICMLKDGRVAFGTAHLNANGFASIFNPSDSSVSPEILTLSGNDINSIDNFKDHLIFIGSNGGINTFDLTSYTVTDTITNSNTQGGLIGPSVVSLLYIPGNGLWALCDNAGLSHRKEDGTWEKFEQPSTLPGIPVGDNRGGLFYHADSGILLVPTSKGLCLFPVKSESDATEGELLVFPNPWRLDCPLTLVTDSAEYFYIYSMDGMLVYSSALSDNGNLVIQPQSLSEIASGLYFVVAKSNKTTARGRLVIVR
ncbi:T9SS type A sorting domain-containing protein [candidate division WOR-3 bacterium]|nr:T9SS type A sorting domain-containing protein [candidate division WOR-3 bacterium]